MSNQNIMFATFQLIKLDSLAVYWNPNTEQYDGQDKAAVLSKLTGGVADSEKDPGFQYCMLLFQFLFVLVFYKILFVSFWDDFRQVFFKLFVFPTFRFLSVRDFFFGQLFNWF